MKVNKHTRISDLIKLNKDSIDAIASLAKPLEKLKNPILRKLMASRVTISEAAQMGGCSIQDFERVLTPLGFKFSDSEMAEENLEDTPEWLKKLSNEKIDFFDVRDILSEGKDPLKQITKRFKEIQAGNALCIINTFIPVPLVRLFEKDGVKSFTKTIHPNEFHTYFYKLSKPENSEEKLRVSDGKLRMLDEESFAKECNKFSKEKIREIDVRHLEMPAPMQTILKILPELKNDEALFVNHKRVPLYLLEEIADQNYLVNILSLSEIDVKLLIFKVNY